MYPLFVDRNGYFRELLFDLQGFVAHFTYGRIDAGNVKTLGFSFVSPAESGHFEFLVKQPNQVFGMWCLSGAAYRNVSYRDGGYGKLFRMENFHFEELVPDGDNEAI